MATELLTTVHPEYQCAMQRWEVNRDACEGEMAVKAKGRKYLPDDNEEYSATGAPQGRSIRADGADPMKFERKYQNYLRRASFMTVAQHTRNGWVGMAFNNDPVVELPTELQYLIENADGGGQSLVQLGKRTMTDIAELGRYGLLVDSASVERDVSQAEADEMGLKPSIIGYRAEDILDWDEEKIGNKTVLTMVKLRRCFYDRDDEDDTADYSDLEHEYTYYRLTDGACTYQRYDDSNEPIDDAPVPMTYSGGTPLDFIPFYFVGAENNKPNVDDSPLSGIVDLNLSHYRNSADEEALNHTHAAPMLHIDTGQNQAADAFTKANPNGIRTGDAVITQGGGTVAYQQIASDAAISNLMAAKEERMEKIGARYAGEGNSKDVTAEAARINAAFTTSTLTTAVGNVSEAIEAALIGVAKMLNVAYEPITQTIDGEQVQTKVVAFELSKDFYGETLIWQAIQPLVDLYDRGLLTLDGLKVALKQSSGVELDGNGDAPVP